MALVQGEDSESDEEINTEEMHALALSVDGSLAKIQPSLHKSAGIVAGEESETDNEEEDISSEQVDGGQPLAAHHSANLKKSESPIGSSRSSLDSSTPVPPSLLHQKLRDTNLSLRHNIVSHVLRLYRTTCRNLTTVNDNLSKAQGTIEKVNSHLKQSDQELERLNAIMAQVELCGRTFATTVCVDLPTTSPSRRRQLFKSSPEQPRPSPLPTAITNESHN